MIEKNFDVLFISDLALREKQIQQNYRPIIAVHKWFARRPIGLYARRSNTSIWKPIAKRRLTCRILWQRKSVPYIKQPA